MLTFRSLVSAFRRLEIERRAPVLVHASLSAFGQVQGGAESVVAALLTTFDQVMAPAFTYKTMLIPECGPANNGSRYGSGKDTNRMAEFFHPEMPVDRLIGAIPEALRRHPRAKRSSHPILSFTGVGVEAMLPSQTLADPLAPIGMLAGGGGWVLLLGVDHTVNTSIHYGEQLAGRKQFVRWALTSAGVVECPRFPTCSMGFDAISPHLEDFSRCIEVGPALVQAVPLPALIEAVCSVIAADPLALLCHRPGCEGCAAVRNELKVGSSAQRSEAKSTHVSPS